jgi:hypothetical protein
MTKEYDSEGTDDFFLNPLLTAMKTFIIIMEEFETTSFMSEMLNSKNTSVCTIHVHNGNGPTQFTMRSYCQ